MSRLKDEHMEQDLLVEYSSRFLHYYNHNKPTVIGGGLGIILIIGLVIGFFIYSANQEREAQVLLGVAEEFYRQGDLQAALNGDDQSLAPGFIQIADNYSGTESGNLAHYYAAVIEYESGNYENALSYIEGFTPPDGILGVGPISFHGVILTELGRYENAAQKFIEAAGWDENVATTPYNLMEAAIAYDAAGMTDEALERLNTIVAEYPESQRAGEAERMRATLTRGA